MIKYYAIIGGGIIGSAIARELLLQKKGDVDVFEKESSLGKHASGRNSGVLHSGINQKPGSLKARMCLEGNRKARTYCLEHNVAMEECGTLVIARNEIEKTQLEYLRDLGNSVGVECLRIIERDELCEREPEVIADHALFSPHGTIVDSVGFLKSVADEVKSLGGIYHFNTEVISILPECSTLITNQGPFSFGHIINCAGLYADKIAHLMNVGLDYVIIPFRGEYYEVKDLHLNSMVYQVPNLKYPFLGVHLTKAINGEVLAGPNATLSFGRESYEKQINLTETFAMVRKRNFWRLLTRREFINLAYHNLRTSFSSRAFLEEIQSITPDVRTKQISSYRSGIRAQMVTREGKMLDDLVVEYAKDSTHILNAVSPGMTTSLAFAEYIVKNLPP